MQNFPKFANLFNRFRRTHAAFKLDRIISVLRLNRDLHNRKLFRNNIALQIVAKESSVVGFPDNEPPLRFAAKAQICAATHLLHKPKSDLVYGCDMLLARIVFKSTLLCHQLVKLSYIILSFGDTALDSQKLAV